MTNFGRSNLSNYENEPDKLRAHLEELSRKHKALDDEISQRFHNQNINEEVRRLKTHKLFLKDEIYRIKRQLEQIGAYTNGRH
jgi:hypothetical protein